MSDLIGRSLGRYRIVELLGAGGMGEVYRAHDTKLRRDVAIKVLSNDITQDRGHLERFEREARALAQLSHSNILAIHDLCADDGVTFAVEELLEGRDLRRELAHGRMAKDRVIEVISAVAVARARDSRCHNSTYGPSESSGSRSASSGGTARRPRATQLMRGVGLMAAAAASSR